MFCWELEVIQQRSVGIDSVLTPLIFSPRIATLVATVYDVRRVAESKHQLIVKVVLSWHVPAGRKVVHARLWSLRRHVKPEGR